MYPIIYISLYFCLINKIAIVLIVLIIFDNRHLFKLLQKQKNEV